MVTIEYMGMDPEEVELVNSPEFRAALDAHPNVRLVTVTEDDKGNDIYHEASLPLSATGDNVAVLEWENEDSFLWVLFAEDAHVHDPSPAFIDILKVMDAYSVKTYEERLFLSPDEDVLNSDPEVLAAPYDFNTGDYIL